MSFLLLFLTLVALPARADFSASDFERLAVELAPKVNLFQDVWEKDPSAELYGGTTRDFLYWIKGQLLAGRTPEELRALPVIDVRDFIVGDSDVDIIAAHHLGLSKETYGVRKIDYISRARFDPSTGPGQDELKQGYIPAEKIRLSRNGFVKWGDRVNGVEEIFTGKLTVHFAPPDVFASTSYAKQRLNHPVLLALRYLRLVAIDYFRRHGSGVPRREELLAFDGPSKAAVREVLEHALTDPTLAECLGRPDFVKWINSAVRRAFLSYTNPTAAKVLFDGMGVADLIARYPEIQPYHHYLFSKYRDKDKIAAAMKRFNVREETFFQDPRKIFRDGYLYHGTTTDDAFRSILFQGILPSEGGTAGAGLYGVARNNLPFAIEWGKSEDRVVKLEVKPGARIVDITQGEGERVFREFRGSIESFAETFGVDIIAYPYPTRAFVVKNSDALGRPVGHKIQLLSLSSLIERAKRVNGPAEVEELMKLIELNRVNEKGLKLILIAMRDGASDPAARASAGGLLEAIDGNPPVKNVPYVAQICVPLAKSFGVIARLLGQKFLRDRAPSSELFQKVLENRPEVIADYLLPELDEASVDRLWDGLQADGRARILKELLKAERPGEIRFFERAFLDSPSQVKPVVVASRVMPKLAKEEGAIERLWKENREYRQAMFQVLTEARVPSSWEAKVIDLIDQEGDTKAIIQLLEWDKESWERTLRGERSLDELSLEYVLRKSSDPNFTIRIKATERLLDRALNQKLPKTRRFIEAFFRLAHDPCTSVRETAYHALRTSLYLRRNLDLIRGFLEPTPQKWFLDGLLSLDREGARELFDNVCYLLVGHGIYSKEAVRLVEPYTQLVGSRPILQYLAKAPPDLLREDCRDPMKRL